MKKTPTMRETPTTMRQAFYQALARGEVKNTASDYEKFIRNCAKKH